MLMACFVFCVSQSHCLELHIHVTLFRHLVKMNIAEELNEKLRELCCLGDVEGVYKCLSQGADVNSKNKINGWTSLHWASKRGHINLIQILLKAAADPTVCNQNGDTPLDIASNDKVSSAFHQSFSDTQNSFIPVKVEGSASEKQTPNSFTPNYLKHPVFPYVNRGPNNKSFSAFTTTESNNSLLDTKSTGINSNELVLKIRTANSEDKDFIEVELENDFTYDNLVKICIKELEISLDEYDIKKLRKLPDTIIRKDKDVMRFQQFQEIEVVLKSKQGSIIL